MADAYEKYPEYGFIYSNMWHCDSDLNASVVNPWIGPVIPEQTNLFRPRIAHLKTFHRDAYLKTKGYDPNQKKSVDKDIIFKLEEVTKLKYIDIPLYYYRFHESGISQGKNKFKAWVYLYIARCKAYQRRLNTDIPNLTLGVLYTEYFKITLRPLINFYRSLKRYFRISRLTRKIPNLTNKIKKTVKKVLIRDL